MTERVKNWSISSLQAKLMNIWLCFYAFEPFQVIKLFRNLQNIFAEMGWKISCTRRNSTLIEIVNTLASQERDQSFKSKPFSVLVTKRSSATHRADLLANIATATSEKFAYKRNIYGNVSASRAEVQKYLQWIQEERLNNKQTNYYMIFINGMSSSRA